MFFRADAPADRPNNELRALRFSMNTPVVALEGLAVGPARAAVALHDGPETRVTVALRAVRSAQLLYFCAGDELADLPSAAVAVDAALSFAESMGFLFDDDVVESSGEGGGHEAAAQWARFIDAVVESSAPRSAAAAPTPRSPRPERPAEPIPIHVMREPDASARELTPIAASVPEDLQGDEAARAPLAMLEDDHTPDEMPFWLLQPDPPRRSSRPPSDAPASPNIIAELDVDPEPRPPDPEPKAIDADAIGLSRRASAPPRARISVAPAPAPPRAERSARRSPRNASPRPEPRRSELPEHAKHSARRVAPSAVVPAEIPGELREALAETGIDQILMGAGSVLASRDESLPAEPIAPEAGPSAPPPAAESVAEQRSASATLSKFRIHASAAAKGAKPRTPDPRGSADERRGDTEPGREFEKFESLGLRLRSRF